ncbi:MAG: hypothetical protein E7270_01360 [Lachnospiraceae bacterium]|nr:hypothetical protein [Lachnospiraceae bacterium]
MTKKQLKKLAKEFADLEIIIQKNESVDKVDSAKEKMMKLTQSADLELNEMIELDEMIRELITKQLDS